jgi:hypothetical protein
MEHSENQDKGYSRRQFLKGLPLGIAGAFAVTSIAGRMLLGRKSQRRTITFDDDSIFAPDRSKSPNA